MVTSLFPLQYFIATLALWLNRQQQEVIDYLSRHICDIVERALVQIDGASEKRPVGWSLHQVESTALQTAGAARPWTPRRPSANWPFRMRCSSSMPAIVIAAVLNRLKPSIGPMRCFMALWSCSIRLFRYFDERTFVSSGNRPSAFISRTAR